MLDELNEGTIELKMRAGKQMPCESRKAWRDIRQRKQGAGEEERRGGSLRAMTTLYSEYADTRKEDESDRLRNPSEPLEPRDQNALERGETTTRVRLELRSMTREEKVPGGEMRRSGEGSRVRVPCLPCLPRYLHGSHSLGWIIERKIQRYGMIEQGSGHSLPGRSPWTLPKGRGPSWRG